MQRVRELIERALRSTQESEASTSGDDNVPLHSVIRTVLTELDVAAKEWERLLRGPHPRDLNTKLLVPLKGTYQDKQQHLAKVSSHDDEILRVLRLSCRFRFGVAVFETTRTGDHYTPNILRDPSDLSSRKQAKQPHFRAVIENSEHGEDLRVASTTDVANHLPKQNRRCVTHKIVDWEPDVWMGRDPDVANMQVDLETDTIWKERVCLSAFATHEKITPAASFSAAQAEKWSCKHFVLFRPNNGTIHIACGTDLSMTIASVCASAPSRPRDAMLRDLEALVVYLGACHMDIGVNNMVSLLHAAVRLRDLPILNHLLRRLFTTQETSSAPHTCRPAGRGLQGAEVVAFIANIARLCDEDGWECVSDCEATRTLLCEIVQDTRRDALLHLLDLVERLESHIETCLSAGRPTAPSRRLIRAAAETAAAECDLPVAVRSLKLVKLAENAAPNLEQRLLGRVAQLQGEIISARDWPRQPMLFEAAKNCTPAGGPVYWAVLRKFVQHAFPPWFRPWSLEKSVGVAKHVWRCALPCLSASGAQMHEAEHATFVAARIVHVACKHEGATELLKFLCKKEMREFAVKCGREACAHAAKVVRELVEAIRVSVPIRSWEFPDTCVNCGEATSFLRSAEREMDLGGDATFRSLAEAREMMEESFGFADDDKYCRAHLWACTGLVRTELNDEKKSEALFSVMTRAAGRGRRAYVWFTKTDEVWAERVKRHENVLREIAELEEWLCNLN